MAAIPYMQLYIADYLADTKHLKGIEHGVYLLLMMHYWQTGKPLKLNDERLALISCVSLKEFRKVKPIISEFFIEQDERWYHKRIETDLELIDKKCSNARASAMKGVEARISERSANAQRTLSERSANAQRPTDTSLSERSAIRSDQIKSDQNRSDTKEIQKKIDVANAPPVRAEIFEVFNFWKEKFNHPRQSLNDSYKKIISLALKNLTLADCLDAIEGCSLTPHNIGQNDTGQKWDGLHIIFDFKKGNPARFIKNKHDPPTPKNLKIGQKAQNLQRAAEDIIQKLQDKKNDNERNA